ncbi:hypothetical protein RND71_019306 [Anisodus tanguticus]|uniref:Uncharacterized protein n=1 Tax=Anisodus tanguticus TaxID=243964 RepID=A0AAE1VGC0_9SOLA|nr:hypothetical protein RND71_019306 [Anisodus tanguticus]
MMFCSYFSTTRKNVYKSFSPSLHPPHLLGRRLRPLHHPLFRWSNFRWSSQRNRPGYQGSPVGPKFRRSLGEL